MTAGFQGSGEEVLNWLAEAVCGLRATIRATVELVTAAGRRTQAAEGLGVAEGVCQPRPGSGECVPLSERLYNDRRSRLSSRSCLHAKGEARGLVWRMPRLSEAVATGHAIASSHGHGRPCFSAVAIREALARARLSSAFRSSSGVSQSIRGSRPLARAQSSAS